uniref:Flocculation protein FLO11-like n=1 Tax=Heterorhabditis bacteriophora TaxID=37862 RepID=A0A1I7XQ26_HETBA
MTQSVYTPSRHPTETVRERLIKKPTTMTASMPNTPLGIAKSSSPLVTSKKTSLPPRNISTTVTPKKPAAKLRRTLPSMREFIPTISQPITPTVQEETELSLEKEFSPSILTEQVNSDTLNDSVSICVPLQSEIELAKIDLMPATIHTDKMDTLIDITSESEEPSSIKEKAERKEIEVSSSEVLQKLEEESKAAEERKARVAAILAKSRANGRVSPPSAPTNDSRLISQSELQSTDVSDVLKRLASNSNLPMLQKLIARHASDPKLTEQVNKFIYLFCDFSKQYTDVIFIVTPSMI